MADERRRDASFPLLILLFAALLAGAIGLYVAGQRHAEAKGAKPPPSLLVLPPEPPSPSPSASPSALPKTTIPYGEAALRANPIYKSPTPGEVECELPKIEKGKWASTQAYLKGVSDCLDLVWTRQFEEMNVFYDTPDRTFLRSRLKTSACGSPTPPRDEPGTYCPSHRAFWVLAEKNTWSKDSTYALALRVAHEYAHHVQLMANITPSLQVVRSGGPASERALITPRIDNQAGCFAGASLRALRDALPSFAKLKAGIAEGTGTARYGEWLQRGYQQGLKACDTWSAPASKIR